MEGVHPFDWVDYGDSGIINEVDKFVGEMDFGLEDVDVVPIRFRTLPGTGITPADWIDLSRFISNLASEGSVDGIVVTHGTATLEETAFFLRATYKNDLPVVVCGAQRPPNTASSDAVASMRNAIVSAAEAPAGVYVAMNGMLFSPDDVTKTANHALDAFAAPEFGPIGRIEPSGKLSLRRLPNAAPHIFDVAGLGANAVPRVDIVFSYAGADGAAVEAFVAAGAKGIVSCGFPPGRCTSGERASLSRAIERGVVVVQGSRALRGRVPVQKYNADIGILSAGSLSPSRSRIVLMLSLAAGLEQSRIQELLQAW